MEVESSMTDLKNEIDPDAYGEDDNLDHLQNDELVVGDIADDDLHNEEQNGADGDDEIEGTGVEDLAEEHGTGEEDEPGSIERRQSDADDLLYDAVITERTSPSADARQSTDENGAGPTSPFAPASTVTHFVVTGSGTLSQAQRKNSCYVGNLTWWTTDQDMIELVDEMGLSDLIDVKFYENRANGQSKGFALVSFEADSSVRVCMEQMPTKQLHGQPPVVLPYTKQSLAQLEAATASTMTNRKADQGAQGGGNSAGGGGSGGGGGQTVSSGGMNAGSGLDKNSPAFLGVLRIGAGGHSHAPTPFSMGQGHVFVNSMARSGMHGGSMGMGLPPSMGYGGVMRPMGMGPPGMGPPGVSGYPPHMMSRGPPPGPVAPPTPLMRSVPMAPPSQYAGGPVMANAPQPGGGVHVNPHFYPGLAAAHQQQASTGHFGHHPDSGGALGEAEFEEIMNRNRTVSSSAISRAVSDAAVGDYPSAIETLVTALSLIKQSKVAHDDRCKVLIGSLQDTLHGIEAKSYSGSRSHTHHGSSSGASRRAKEHSSTRDRSRSRERTSGGSKRRRRSSSRSREYSPRRTRRY